MTTGTHAQVRWQGTSTTAMPLGRFVSATIGRADVEVAFGRMHRGRRAGLRGRPVISEGVDDE
jgi:hypothetical protein